MPCHGKMYSVTVCPKCGGDLTDLDGVSVECVVDDRAVRHDDMIDSDGLLLDDTCLVKEGKHRGTFCGHCDHSLGAYEFPFEFLDDLQAWLAAVVNATEKMAAPKSGGGLKS